MVKGKSFQPTIETQVLLLSQQSKVENGFWLKAKVKFWQVKTLTVVADLPTAHTYVTHPSFDLDN